VASVEECVQLEELTARKTATTIDCPTLALALTRVRIIGVGAETAILCALVAVELVSALRALPVTISPTVTTIMLARKPIKALKRSGTGVASACACSTAFP
jgi:hypothetical protein